MLLMVVVEPQVVARAGATMSHDDMIGVGRVLTERE